PAYSAPRQLPTGRSSDLDRPVAAEVGGLVDDAAGERDLLVAQRRLVVVRLERGAGLAWRADDVELAPDVCAGVVGRADPGQDLRSEEHTSELQSPDHLVC